MAKKNVILVHGRGSRGSERDFAEFMANMSPEKYNVIPFNYNDRAPLAKSADKLAELVKQNGGAHVLAHSMGGLVARGAAERLADTGEVKSLTTIATPFNGHGAAFLGKWLGGAPSDTDMTRGSKYQKSLARPLKGKVKHMMITVDKDGSGDDDGTISVASQNKRQIVNDAAGYKNVRDTHTGVLRNPDVIRDVLAGIDEDD